MVNHIFFSESELKSSVMHKPQGILVNGSDRATDMIHYDHKRKIDVSCLKIKEEFQEKIEIACLYF